MSTQAQKLVIVESPTKAKTIRKFLGKEYRVEASMGHVRDLPASAEEIPDDIRSRPWARLGVDVENGFEPVYVVPADKKKTVAELRKAVREARELYIATDEDREGESIGWHLVQVLGPKIPTHRMVFHEITADAIRNALASTRQINERLVQAQETRRVLDRLVGYVVSPLLWKKVAPRLSAGRVQSVAVRLLVLRERERLAFVTSSYWDLRAHLEHDRIRFDADLHSVDGRRVATGRDFDPDTGRLLHPGDVVLLGETEARDWATRLEGHPARVLGVDRKQSNRSPYPPFTTSTLQQEANRKLGLGAGMTMQVAQRLYENGFITYMRTDSTNLSEEAINAARALVSRRYGDAFLAPAPRRYATKSKGAQEAHEAIRPAGTQMATADELGLRGPEARLYDMIWKRTIASQMADARVAMTTVRLATTDDGGRTAEFRATGREVLFDGFFRAYVESTDDPEDASDDRSAPLPRLAEGDAVHANGYEPLGHETRPPARFTEATLVKALEKEGIGRPSTYASIIDTIQRRGYVLAKNRQLVPTFTAFAVTRLLEETLAHIVDVDFTAAMEERLDEIADGTSALAYLQAFYDRDLLGGVASGQSLDPRRICTIESAKFAPYVVRVGKFGPYIEVPREDDEKPATASLPDDTAPADLTREIIEDLIARKGSGDEPLGVDPISGEPVFVLNGRFGPFVQLGHAPEDPKVKPRRASLPKGLAPTAITLRQALDLLALPRVLGNHPETGEPIRADNGRFGPYVQHGRVFASLRAQDDVLTIALPRALELIAEKETRGSRRGADALREMGDHPELGGPVAVRKGPFGIYVNHNKVNAGLPEGTTPESLTMEQAVELLRAQAEKVSARGGKPGRSTRTTSTAREPRAAATAKKPATRKPAAKKADDTATAEPKPAAKKPAAKKPAAK